MGPCPLGMDLGALGVDLGVLGADLGVLERMFWVWTGIVGLVMDLSALGMNASGSGMDFAALGGHIGFLEVDPHVLGCSECILVLREWILVLWECISMF